MSWQPHWQGDAVGELLDPARADRRQADRIYRAIEALARSDQGDVRKLAARQDEWRLRVGDWRVFFTYNRAAQTLIVLAVKRRDEGTYRD